MPLTPTLIDFVENTDAKASEVDENFAILKNQLDTWVVLLDIARTITAKHNLTAAGAIQIAGVDLVDVAGKLNSALLPSIAINDVFVVASQAAMLALVAQRGDMAIRTDESKTYVLSTDSPGTLADWKEITVSPVPTPAPYYGARAYRSGTNQSIGAGTPTKIQFNAETRDPRGYFDSGANYRFQPTQAGRYLVHAQFSESSGDSFTAERRILIYKNGLEVARKQFFMGTANAQIDITDELELNGSSDYVEIFAYGGDAVTVLLGSTLTFASFALTGSL